VKGAFGGINYDTNTSSPIELDDKFETRVFSPKKKPKYQKPMSTKFLSFKEGNRFIEVKERRESLKDLKAKWKNTLKPKEKIIEDKIQIKIPKRHKNLANNIDRNTEQLYDFFMTEIIPLYTAIGPSLEKTVKHASHLLDVDAEIDLDQKVLKMIEDTVTLKIFEFISTKFNLTDESKTIIQNKYFTPLSNLIRRGENET